MSEKHSWPDVERRRYPRVKADIAGQMITHARRDQAVVVRSKDISYSGLSCHINAYVAPFQKVHLSMIIPLLEHEHMHNEVIQIGGVTVRVDPEAEDPDVLDYHIAIFFEDVSRKDREILDRYVKQQK